MTRTYYMVSRDKRFWSKDKISVEEFQRRGYHVQAARTRWGVFDVFKDGHKVAVLFRSKVAAMEFIKS